MTAAYTAADGKQILTVDSGRPRAGSAKLLYFDRAADKTVLRAELSGLPAKVRLVNDLAEHRVTHTSSSKIGRFAVVLQRGEGAVSSPRGGHVTMIKNGDAVGVSGLLAGLSGFDVTYGAVPHAHLEVGSSGRSFLGAASIDDPPGQAGDLQHARQGRRDARPGRAEGRLPGQRRDRQGQGRLHRHRSGPTIDGTILGVHDDVKAAWELGERSTVDITSSSTLGKVQIYANKAYVTKPQGEDIKAEVSRRTQARPLVADTAAKTLTWTSDGPVRSVSALARANSQGRYITAAAEVTGVPARFDASWNGDAYRFRGLSGPVGSAAVAFTNHDGAKAPAGPHLSAHYDQATGDLDASVRVKGLSSVEFSPGEQGFTGDSRRPADPRPRHRRHPGRPLRAARQARPAARPPGGLGGRWRADVLGVPARRDGPRLARQGGRAQEHGGRTGRARRHLAGGRRLRRRVSGCAPGAFCTERGCFGVQGYLDVSGLPDQVTVDLAKKAFTFAGFAPKRRSLGVYWPARSWRRCRSRRGPRSPDCPPRSPACPSARST